MKKVLSTALALLLFSGGVAVAQTVAGPKWDTDGMTLWMKLPCMVSRNLDAQAWEFTAGNGIFIMRAMSDGSYVPGWGTPEAYAVFIKECGLPDLAGVSTPAWLQTK